MHEVDMTRALIRTLNQWLAAESESSAVDRVHLVVGRFTCVEPASLRFAFAAQIRGLTWMGPPWRSVRPR